MPTFGLTDVFKKDLASLDQLDRKRFEKAVKGFVEDLDSEGHGFRPSLRVKGVQGAPGVYEMTWSPDGRATFEYGEELHHGQPHIVWRRVGTHDVFSRP
jgi:hypothetical protein